VPEGRRIFGELTVEENLRAGAWGRTERRGSREAYDRVYGLFPRLKERLTTLAGSLSGGEQQMAALGRGLMSRPRLLMVDELSFGLAPIVVEELFRLVKEIRQDGTAFLLVEQSAGVLSVSDRSYVISGGRTVLEGRSSELRQQGAGQLARVYLGAREVESNNGGGRG
jgi:branched-chain amino acid transport system ATP-binding protein